MQRLSRARPSTRACAEEQNCPESYCCPIPFGVVPIAPLTELLPCELMPPPAAPLDVANADPFCMKLELEMSTVEPVPPFRMPTEELLASILLSTLTEPSVTVHAMLIPSAALLTIMLSRTCP